MAKRRIAAAEIQVGKPLPWDVYDATGTLLLAHGYVIDSEIQIDRLIEQGLFVESDPSRRGKAGAERIEEIEEPSTVPIILQARRKLERACRDVEKGTAVDFGVVLSQVRKLIQEACALDPNLSMATILLETKVRYSICHMIDSAIICEVIGGALGLDGPLLDSAVMAALTMNISIATLQDQLQGQSTPLSTEQRSRIQAHPIVSRKMLEGVGVLDAIWLAAIHEHHEAADGTGYPMKKKGDTISEGARLVSLSDVYCARISGRDYRPPILPNKALRDLFLVYTHTHNSSTMSRLVKALGVFPPGTCVELQNAEIGLVISPGEKAHLPIVAAIIGSRGNPYMEPIIRDTSRDGFAVLKSIAQVKLISGINYGALWEKAAVR